MKKDYSNLMKWFSWFFVKKIKVSFLLIAFILLTWIFSLYSIPKESSPDIKFGIISIVTTYKWANPEDIDNLITEKIEKEIKDIDWIKKITSNSSVWFSSTTIELYNNVDTNNVLVDVNDAIDKIKLPEDAEDPIVWEISSNSDLLFQVLLYGDEDKFSYFDLVQKWRIIQNKLEWTNNITKIAIGWDPQNMWLSSWKDDYEIKVLVEKNKLEVLWLSIWQIANTIRAFNQNTPIWNYRIGDLNYDFRIQWEYKNIKDLKNTVIRDSVSSKILLKDIATFKKEYNNEPITSLWFYKKSGFNYITLVFNKKAGTSVFQTAQKAKSWLKELIDNDKNFEGLDIKYTNDLSELIKEDYQSLWGTAIQTLFLVFGIILFFIWFRQSLIASLILPLSFFITFIVLNYLWFSLNFLTNFSLILTLWIAIDAVIVIIDWATDKMRLWYSKVPAILLAINEYKAPLISWTLTTLAAFLPMMFLPWVLWKFLSYIPITVFITLVAVLFLSLTISWALFSIIASEKKIFHKDSKLEENLSQEDIVFLNHERAWKDELTDEKITWREKILIRLEKIYYNILSLFMKNSFFRFLTVFMPIVFLGLSFVFLSPKIWFTLFPQTDNWKMSINMEFKEWKDSKALEKYIPNVKKVLDDYAEIKVFYIKATDWNINANIELINLDDREKNWQMTVFELEKILEKKMDKFRKEWIKVSFNVASNWPPSWSPIWVKLIASNNKKFETLKEVAFEFKNYLQTIEWTKNVDTTSSKTPWQFVFKFKKDKLTSLWLTPNDIIRELYFYIAWIWAWSIKNIYENNDIIVQIKEFEETLSPSDIENITLNTKSWPINMQEILSYNVKDSISALNREDGKIMIKVQSDYEQWYLPSDIQPKLLKYAKNYQFPNGISYKAWWETSENQELIISTFFSFLIALFLMFFILVFQFNSFLQPIIILYSILLAMFWVNIWLFLTWNPYSMPFGIWFIALTWVVVNNAIILIDRINMNLNKGLYLKHAVLNSWKARLQPILVTTLTTISWILPLALQDQFWAWLWYTIIFGLLVGSIMTLFVVPIIYYTIYKNFKK